MYRIQIRHTGKDKPWYWRIVSRNGRIVLTSETYFNRGNAVRAARKFGSTAGWEFTLKLEIEE